MFYTLFRGFSGDRDPGSERGSFADDLIDDCDFDFTDIFNYCGRAGGDRRFSAQGLI